MSKIYLDNAATTMIRDEVIDSISLVMKSDYGNPSSTHSYGRSSKSLIELSRKEIAKLLNVNASEIIFNSGGTEGDNMILRSCVKNLNVNHIITSVIEHHAVTHTVADLEKSSKIKISYVKIDKFGEIDYDDLEKLLKDNTDYNSLVSLMHINNEIGNITDISKVSKICKKYNSLFHTDTVQSVGHYKLDFKELEVDFFVASAHKFHGPKGIGFTYVKKDSSLGEFITGGMQEKGIRAGTESVHNIVGMAEALKISINNIDKEKKYITSLKDYFIKKIRKKIKGVTFNGYSSDMKKSTYRLINVLLPIEKETGSLIMFKLDMKGIACSMGSACQSGSNSGSHVLKAIQTKAENNKISLRFSFSIYNKIDEIDYLIDQLEDLLN